MQKKEEEILGGERFRMIMLKGLNQLKTNHQKKNPTLDSYTDGESPNWSKLLSKGMNWI